MVIAWSALAGSLPAGAHVDAEATQDAGISTITFSFNHGCDGLDTTGIDMQLPPGATEIAPQSPTGWTAQVNADVLSWTGGSIPDGEAASFVASMRIPGEAGETVYLPTLQKCDEGENAWIDRSDGEDVAYPSPRIVLAETVAAPSTTPAPSVAPTSAVPIAPTPGGDGVVDQDLAASDTGDGGGGAGTILVVVGVALVLVIGAVALVARRGRRAEDRSESAS